MSRLEWVAENMRLLRAIAAEFERTRPFEGLVIGTGIHLEPKTAALLLALRAGGAEVIATGNLNSTQPETVAYLERSGIRVIATPTQDAGTHAAELRAILDAEPHLLLDNGGDLFAAWLERPYVRLLGGTEETTSGRMRLAPLHDRLGKPVLVINDSPIKQFAENEHAVGQSVLESLLRITNRATNGLRVTVFGYGACGQGVAANFRAANATVSVVEVDPVARLRALWDGFRVPDRAAALASADLVVTVTGARGVVSAADLATLRDGAILLNAGHFPYELDVPGLAAADAVADAESTADGITSLRLRDGRTVRILTDGHMVNLAGPRPLGNSIEAMDLGFSLQARCLEAVATGAVGPESCVVPVPRAIDEAVAAAYVSLAG
jgi:adenosylhomocysteinase